MDDRCRNQHRAQLEEGEHGSPGSCDCAGCRASRSQLAHLTRAARSVPPAALPDGFQTRLRERLAAVEALPQRAARRRLAWGAGLAACAAAAALALLFGPLAARAPGDGAAGHVVVSLGITGGTTAEPVVLRLLLPEGLRLASREPALHTAHELYWEERPGPDEVLQRTFALEGTRPGRWRLRIEASAGGGTVTEEREIIVGPQGLTVPARTEGASVTPAPGQRFRLSLGLAPGPPGAGGNG